MTKARWIRALRWMLVTLGLAAVALAALLLKWPQREPSITPLPAPEIPESSVLLEDGIRVGSALPLGTVTVFPIYSEKQVDLGPIISLQSALEDGTAEVREHGAEDSPLGGATVGQLVLENKGDASIFVLAGTIVKGGKQDRQIGQDFVVAPHTVASVDAFCVEHGRWTGVRNGALTGGKFEALKQLATSKVRAAGQYEANQGEVWSEVAKVNAKSGKSAPSGTLLATVDDDTIARRRAALSKSIQARLDTTEPRAAVVGMAYAVGGKVRGARWFANRRLFTLFQDVLSNTAAMDALDADPKAKNTVVGPEAVARFVKEVESAPPERKDTAADNVNEYKKAPKGWGSSTKLKRSPKAKGASISKDYVAK